MPAHALLPLAWPFAGSLALPLVLATVFTAGCVAIHKAGRHAERVTETLGLLFIFCAFLCVLVLLARETGMPLGARPRRGRPRPVALLLMPGGRDRRARVCRGTAAGNARA